MPTHRYAFALAAVFAAAPALSAQTGRLPTCDEPAKSPAGAIVLPIYIHFDHVFVKVCAGSRELDFLLDTGAGMSAIDISLAKRMGWDLGKTFGVVGTGPNTSTGFTISNGSLRLARTNVEHSIETAVDIHPVARRAGHVLDGLLGYDFISRFVVAIDYPKQELRLYDRKSFRYAGRGTTLPIRLSRNQPFATFGLNLIDGSTINGEFLVDMGSDIGVGLRAPFIRANRLGERVGSAVHPNGVAGIGGIATRTVGRLNSVNVGPFKVSNIELTLYSDSTDADSERPTWSAGSVGAPMFRDFVVYFDYVGKVMIVEPGSGR